MGKWGSIQVVTAEFRRAADAEDLECMLAEQAIDLAERNGLHPIGTPRLEWSQITEMDVAIELGMQREAGIQEPAAAGKPGDWRVISRLTVAEDAPD